MQPALLPDIFLQQMRDLLPPGEFEAFCATYEQPTVRGLRLNKLKLQGGAFGFDALPVVPWCGEGRYYSEDTRPAKSIFHNAGLFYIQEPSAMCPVEVLKPQPSDRVLDLCAAPGGKSAQIAGFMMGEGLLVSNDASPTRSRALVKNLERLGVTNAVVTTEMPKKLAGRFSEFFDKILVDAPCSGEGMFRRDGDAVKAYTANKPDACVEMQMDILRYAARMLKPSGRLVYSTCTFNVKENEDTICGFLESNPEFSAVAIDHEQLGISSGFEPLPKAGRIFPHRAVGEGHFVALLEKKSHNATNDKCQNAVVGAPLAAPGYYPAAITGSVTNDNATHGRGHGCQCKRHSYKRGDKPVSSTTPQTGFSDFCKNHIPGASFPLEKIIFHGANL